MYSPSTKESISISNKTMTLNKSAALHSASLHGDEEERLWRVSPTKGRASSEDVVPLWSANPQSPPSDENLVRMVSTGSHNSFTAPKGKGSFMFLILVLVGIGAIYTSREHVNTVAEHVSIFEIDRQKLDNKIKKAEKEVHKLKREISAMDIMMQKQQTEDVQSNHMKVANYRALHEMNSLQSRLREEARLSQKLKDKVQKSSHDEIIQKYGPGPHQVKIQLVFPGGDSSVAGPNTFVIELAPADLMPHSVHTFLEMVSSGLLDGCSFILNALHVIKAAPLPYDGSSAAAKAKAFSDRNLESVAFKEYNDQYPHKQFTAGFSADGSPSFYINTEDNSEIHAGDPCFGKVVEGIDTVKRLENSPTRNGIWFEKRIGIKSARIMKAEERAKVAGSSSRRIGSTHHETNKGSASNKKND